MGGKSFHTEIQHKKVWTRYEELIKECGELASSITRSWFHQKISDEMGYSIVTVRKIINTFAKVKTCVCF